MISKNSFHIPSTNGADQLYVTMWKPESSIKCILQISHGMREYMDRYERFAGFLAEKGVLVVGNDHLGHGRSVRNGDELGYFNAKDSSRTVVEDLYVLTGKMKTEYPGVPYFFLGHSMGSFMIRRYAMTYGEEMDGVIIMGTGDQSVAALTAGNLVIAVLGWLKGKRYRSKLVEKLCFGSYNNHLRPVRTVSDWLTRDVDIVDKYNGDKYSSYLFTLKGFKTIFDTLAFIRKPKNIAGIPKTLPMFLVSGKEDPVGGRGKQVSKIYAQYKNCGIKQISMKLYPEDRHEILNELDYEQVYADLYTWLENCMNCSRITKDNIDHIVS